jgi:hypothetical protein
VEVNEIEMHHRAARAAGEESACTGKVRHETERKAQGHARSLNRHPSRQRPGNTDWKEAYPCPFCDGWHVGREMTDEERELYSRPS